MKKEAIKKFFKKFWAIVWKDDSFKGWIISLIFIFVIIKLIFFPILNLVTGTSLPLVIVESCSMYHEDNLFSDFDNWWNKQEIKYFREGINKKIFLEFPFKNGFNKGDILFVTGANHENIKIGDIIIFSGGSNPIIHRVMRITEEKGKFYYSTMGDNNQGQLDIEKKIPEENVIGKAQANVLPYAGWVKLIFFEWAQPPSNKGLCNQN